MILDTLNIRYNNIRGREAPCYIVTFQIQFMKIPILEFIHVFSILDFENYYKNRFLFLFSILIKLFDHEIVNCEIIHDVSMLIYILTTENVKNSNKNRKISEFFSKLQQKVFQKSSFFEISKGYPL